MSSHDSPGEQTYTQKMRNREKKKKHLVHTTEKVASSASETKGNVKGFRQEKITADKPTVKGTKVKKTMPTIKRCGNSKRLLY